MTNNQHGQVPEALQLADEISKAGAFPAYPRAPYEAAAAELRRLHAENEALRTAHVRGPAEIEHVAGDVSKNGPELNMAPQPSPTTQAADSVPAVDQSVMELAESVGLIGPTSRIGDLHAAIQRFHDLICVNATIKAATMAAEVISSVAMPDLQDAVVLLRKYRRLCQEVGRGDSAHLDRIEAAAVAVQTVAACAPADSVPASVDGPTRWFTVVYRDISAGDEARLLGEHPKASAMSWSHAIRDRDAARKQGANHD